MEDILLDENGNFAAIADGDCATVTGLECLLQDVRHLLLTFPGDLWSHPDYGTGIQQYIQSVDTELNRLGLQQLIKTRLSTDDRINHESIKVSVNSWVRDRIRLIVRFLPAKAGFETDEDAEDIGLQEAGVILSISQDGISFENL